MERRGEKNLTTIWRYAAAILIYPISIVAGVNGVLLLVSSVCVRLESWSLEGAMSNLSLGFPLLAGVTALWASTLYPFALLARNRYRFVLVATGILMGLVVDCQFVIGQIRANPAKALSLEFYEIWMILGPLVAGSVNLVYLINARNHINDQPLLEPVRVIPPHHLTSDAELRPVVLQPYRRPVSRP
jgi:hypothetical protein